MKSQALSEFVQSARHLLPGLKIVYLFGSQATETAGTESDVDLALMADKALTREQMVDLKIDALRTLGVPVDLVDLFTASTVLTFQVIESGTVLFTEAPATVAEFETTALAKYCNFNEERKELLKDIQKRGFIHAR